MQKLELSMPLSIVISFLFDLQKDIHISRTTDLNDSAYFFLSVPNYNIWPVILGLERRLLMRMFCVLTFVYSLRVRFFIFIPSQFPVRMAFILFMLLRASII